MGRGPDAAKRELWRRRLREFERGDWTVAAFCNRLGVSQPTFYEWRRKLAADEARCETLTFVPLAITGQAGIEVHLPGGVLISVPSRDREAIQSVITALLRAGRDPARQEEAC